MEVLITRTFQCGWGSWDSVLLETQVYYLSGGKVAEHHVLALSFGLWGRKKGFYLKQRVAGSHPCFLFILFQTPLFFRNQELAFPRSLCFEPVQPNQGIYSLNVSTSVTQQRFLQWKAHWRLFNNLGEGKGTFCGVLGIPTDSDGT